MKTMAIIGGIVGSLISLLAMLFAIVDDSYTFGNIGLLGIVSGIIGIYGGLTLFKNNMTGSMLLLLSTVLGIVSISFLYAIPAILMLTPVLYVNTRK